VSRHASHPRVGETKTEIPRPPTPEREPIMSASSRLVLGSICIAARSPGRRLFSTEKPPFRFNSRAKSVPSSASADIPNCTGVCFATFQCFGSSDSCAS
jgi:hypothetical protein